MCGLRGSKDVPRYAKSLLETIVGMRKDLHEELGLVTQVKTKTTQTLVETRPTRRELERKLKKSKPGPPSWQANFLPPKRIM
jgi:hypothetical protein